MPVPVKPFHRQSERGSVLIIVAVAIIFASLVFSVGLGHLKIEDDQDKTLTTAQKQKFLVGQLAAYAQRENRVPCPADPSVDPATPKFGFAIGSAIAVNGTGDANDGGKCLNQYEGIIPFRTLGLEPYDAVDAWGNLMTYRVNPVSANAWTIPSSNAHIFMRCRRFPWFDDGVKVYNSTNAGFFKSSVNVYPAKAMFCCPPDDNPFPISSDMLVKASSTSATPINGITGRRGLDYDTVNTITPNGYDQIPSADGTEEVFAFSLISHGPSGGGAYVAGTKNSLPLPATVSTDKTLNASPYSGPAPMTTIDHPMVLTPGANYFDDLVVWRTQVSLMAELGNASCYAPWR